MTLTIVDSIERTCFVMQERAPSRRPDEVMSSRIESSDHDIGVCGDLHWKQNGISNINRY